jgi:hypothetical protein
MISRALVVIAWLIILWVMVGVAKLPGGPLDIYTHDRYFVVSKLSLVLAIIVLFVLPLVTLTVKSFRPTHR